MQKCTGQTGARTHFCKENPPQVLSQALACAQAEGSPNTYLPTPQYSVLTTHKAFPWIPASPSLLKGR